MAIAPRDPTLDRITPEFLTYFNRLKQDVEAATQGVAHSTTAIISLAEQIQSAINPDDTQQLQNAVTAEVKRGQNHATRGRGLLDQMKQEGERLRLTNPDSERLHPYRVHYLRLCKQYVAAMKDHQKAKETMRQLQTDDIVRRGKLVVGDTMSEAEIRQAAQRDPAGFLREVVMKMASDDAQTAYVEAQSRARDIEQLARSIDDMAAMFQDLASLVQHQSELLDNIEYNVDNAVKHTRIASQELLAGIKHKKRTRKLCCYIFCVLLLAIIALLAGIGAGLHSLTGV